MTYYIYSLTNKLNNKTYVGKTGHLKRRLTEHYCSSKYPIGNALRKYGKENFLYQVIEEYPTEEEAYEAERFFIQYLGTLVPFGYNLDSGGTGGKQPCEETRKKISEAMKGNTPWNKGKTEVYSEETRQKMSEIAKGNHNSSDTEFQKGQEVWNKGKTFSEETRKKMSAAHKGRKASKETKEKMSKTRKGRPSSMKGKHHTEETKRKMSNVQKNMSAETRRKMSEAHKGKKGYWAGKKRPTPTNA